MSNKTETKKFWCHLYSCFNMRTMTAKLESLKGTLGKIMGPSLLIHSMNLKYSKINTESGNIHLENNLFLSNIFSDDDSSELFVWYWLTLIHSMILMRLFIAVIELTLFPIETFSLLARYVSYTSNFKILLICILDVNYAHVWYCPRSPWCLLDFL